MKKTLFLFATAAIALASCSSDDTIAENMSLGAANEISFRAFKTNITRAQDASFSTTGNRFKVTAFETGGTTSKYFANETFTRQDNNTFTSTNKHYWPSSVNLDFYAWQPASLSAGTGDYTSFEITPDAAAANQIDFVYAVTKDWGKKSGTVDAHLIDGDPAGVTINFRHAESKVVLKLKNTNSNIKVTVEKASICNVLNKGTFSWNRSTNGAGTPTTADNTDDNTTGSDTHVFYLDGNWSTAGATSTSYEQNVEGVVTDEAALAQDWILIPQTLTQVTVYPDATGTAEYAGPCIKVNLKIQNNITSGSEAYIVGGADTYVTAMWPIQTITWLPGHKYTFVVDLAGGGYYTKNDTNIGTGTDLDPILDGAEIKFVSATVDNWLDADGSVYTTGLE